MRANGTTERAFLPRAVHCSYAPALICPLALTRGLPAKSSMPTTVEPRFVPSFTAGDVDATSRFGGSVAMLSNWGSANGEFASCPDAAW